MKQAHGMGLDGVIVKTVALFFICAVIGYIYFNIEYSAQPKVYALPSADSGQFFASDDVASAQVYYFNGSEVKPCILSKDAGIWRCSDYDWNFVAATSRGMDGVLKKCVWAHPITNKTLRIIFTGVQTGSRIAGFFGLDDSAPIENPGAVSFSVIIDGTSAYRGSAVTPGVHEFDIPTSSGKKDIEFSISTDNDKRRHFCFDAWSVNA